MFVERAIAADSAIGNGLGRPMRSLLRIRSAARLRSFGFERAHTRRSGTYLKCG
jgi:hypothetical protein